LTFWLFCENFGNSKKFENLEISKFENRENLFCENFENSSILKNLEISKSGNFVSLNIYENLKVVLGMFPVNIT
jgi:hypothetical protein